MVGLPARGKSYITKKTARYLNWLQHDTRIFNVGERRREAAAAPTRSSEKTARGEDGNAPATAAKILINGRPADESSFEPLPPAMANDTFPGRAASPQIEGVKRSESPFDQTGVSTPEEHPNIEAMEQSAYFFDPKNKRAAQIREQVAMSTLDELLDYVLEQGGSVGILDATNSTLERRKMIMKRVRERAGPELGVLFLESLCVDETVSSPPKQPHSSGDRGSLLGGG
jgi:6-phosphofructo-2-kinase